MTTTKLKLPELTASQSQKHITHNEALFFLDNLVQLTVIDRDLATPPGSPVLGATYLVGPAPTGSWTGKTDQIASYDGAGWIFFVPEKGWKTWIEDEEFLVVYNGTTWVNDWLNFNNLSGVGINASYDLTNKLVVASEAVLFTNVGNSTQLKTNKAAAGDTASLLFQTGFSGRAEMGTMGSDNFAVKVSADGSTWTTALSVDPASGTVTGSAVQQASTDATTGRLMRADYGYSQATLIPSQFATYGGTANAITLAPIVSLAALTVGLQIRFRATSANTGGVTINVSGTGAITCRTITGVALPAGYIRTDTDTVATYDGTYWVVDRQIEVGSNANGTYTKYADGKMTCISATISGQDVTTGTGSIFRTASLGTWTFPAAFAATPPIVLAGSAGSNTSTHWGNARPLTTTTAEYTTFGPASISGRSIILRAEGKWF